MEPGPLRKSKLERGTVQSERRSFMSILRFNSVRFTPPSPSPTAIRRTELNFHHSLFHRDFQRPPYRNHLPLSLLSLNHSHPDRRPNDQRPPLHLDRLLLPRSPQHLHPHLSQHLQLPSRPRLLELCRLLHAGGRRALWLWEEAGHQAG
jgi:hypothetical protein